MVEIRLPKYNYNILIEFAHIHLDFQRCELESVLGMHGLFPTKDYTEIPLPIYDDELKKHFHRPFMILSFSIDRLLTQTLFRSPLEDHDEIIPESLMDRYCNQSTESSPTLATILSRCTLVRSAIELWGAGSSFNDCVLSIKSQMTPDGTNNTKAGVICHQLEKVGGENQSWKITIQTLGWTGTRDEQAEMRNHFQFLNFLGPVKMDDPDNEFIVIREIELDPSGSASYPRYDHKKQLIQENDQRPPLGIYFGRILGHNRNYRLGIEKFNLKKRIYLGPTSMDAELSFIMTSLGQVKRGSFCFDPFVGTGSLLLTCAMKGAKMCFGTDIDIRVLRGKNSDETIYNNFAQYGLIRPELVRSDNAIFHRHYRSTMQPMFDAIITGKLRIIHGKRNSYFTV